MLEEKILAKEGASTLGAYERNLIKDMLGILEPFEEATDCAQRQNSVSASLVIPCVEGLKIHMDHMKSKYNAKMVFALSILLERRMTQYKDSAVYRLATMLEPQLKSQ